MLRTLEAFGAAICIAAASACSSAPSGDTATKQSASAASQKPPITQLSESLVVSRDSFPALDQASWQGPHIHAQAATANPTEMCHGGFMQVPHGPNADLSAGISAGEPSQGRYVAYGVSLIQPLKGQAPDWPNRLNSWIACSAGHVQRITVDRMPSWATTAHVDDGNIQHLFAVGNYRGVTVVVQAQRIPETTVEDTAAVTKLFLDEISTLENV